MPMILLITAFQDSGSAPYFSRMCSTKRSNANWNKRNQSILPRLDITINLYWIWNALIPQGWGYSEFCLLHRLVPSIEFLTPKITRYISHTPKNICRYQHTPKKYSPCFLFIKSVVFIYFSCIVKVIVILVLYTVSKSSPVFTLMALNWCTTEIELLTLNKKQLSVQQKVLTPILTIPKNTENFDRRPASPPPLSLPPPPPPPQKKKKKSVLKVTPK